MILSATVVGSNPGREHDLFLFPVKLKLTIRNISSLNEKVQTIEVEKKKIFCEDIKLFLATEKKQKLN